MKNSKAAWEQEYSKKRFMTGDKPQKSVLKFVKFLKKQGMDFDEKMALDLGSGEGKNALYLAGLGMHVNCIEIAQNAVDTTKSKVLEGNLTDSVLVKQGSIGEPYDFSDNTFDVVIDVTSSNSLSESERDVYLSESARVLKPDGHMFVRALCRDGDDNAKYLLKNNPGTEHDTYVQPEWGLVERVFSESDLRELYGQYFNIVHLERETHYTTFESGGQQRKYKRNFWVMYLQAK